MALLEPPKGNPPMDTTPALTLHQPRLRVVVCLFGIIQRSIRITWPAIAARIVNVLLQHQMLVKIAVFSLDAGDALVDGCRMEPSDIKLIPHDYLEVVQRAHVDSIIDTHCTPSLSACPLLMNQNATHTVRRNALRQMYSEAEAGRFLNRTGSDFDAAIVIGPDFYPLDNVSVSDVREAASRRKNVFVSLAYPAGGFTNGFYIGHPQPTSLILRRAEPYLRQQLKVRAGRGYEGTLRAAFVQYEVGEKYTDFLFLKVRANAAVNTYALYDLCMPHRGVRPGLSTDGLNWLKDTLSRLESKLRLPIGQQCLNALPSTTFDFNTMQLADSPPWRYPKRAHSPKTDVRCPDSRSGTLSAAAGQERPSIDVGQPKLPTPRGVRGTLNPHTLNAYQRLRTRRTAGASSPACSGYTPSTLEEAWVNAWKQWEAQRTPVTRRVLCELDSSLGPPRRGRDASALHCGGKRVAMEPLVGLLRNPLFPCQNASLTAALDPSFLWLDELPPVASDSAAYLLDMGASTWTGGGPGEQEVGASATQWLIELFAKKGVAFDRILAWEATPHTSSRIWSAMPTEIRARTSYYNIPISDDQNSSSHPWRHLLELAHPNDFVVVKLDVDHPAIEANLISQLKRDPEILARVDVLLWEQHWFQATTASQPACSGAGELCLTPGFHRRKHVGVYPRTSFSKTVDAFVLLRQLGVLAHYWY